MPWQLKFQEAIVYHELIIGSDHAPIRLNLLPQLLFDKRKAPFRFDQRWMEFDQCDEIIKAGWKVSGSCQNKLSGISDTLKKWSKLSCRNSSVEIRNTQLKLAEIQEGVRDKDMIAKEKSLEDDLNKLWRQEEIYWKQRAGKRWLMEGDKNTSFFHAGTVKRRQINRILKLKTEDGD
ncbi:hypothetical protein LINPERHAP2_LOCUS40257 [Linum perenne]